MGKRRTRVELLCDVLESIDTGVKKPTHILYKTNLSWTVLKDILEMLQMKEYIEKQEIKKYATKTRVHYSLTNEGKDMLTNIQYLRNTLTISV